MVKVILRENVEGVGRCGEVKQVKDGFARNFLFPKNLALIATDDNLKKIDVERKKIESKLAIEKKNAQELAKKLSDLSITIAVEVNEEDKLYGGLTAQDIAKAAASEGVEIDKKAIVLDGSIKSLGIFDLDVKLHPEVVAKIKVWVVKK